MLLYTLPIIAAFTGYLTNYVAVKMLFRPRKPISFGFFSVQGIFPKRQKDLAEKLGDLVAQELFSVEDVNKSLRDGGSMDQAKEIIEAHLDVFLNTKLIQQMPMLAMFLNDENKAVIKKTLMEEMDSLLPELLEKISGKLESELDIREVVKAKVNAFSSEKLEALLYSIMRKEFTFIEWLGALLGFIIGLIQLGLVYYS